jgi:hypothetical protein
MFVDEKGEFVQLAEDVPLRCKQCLAAEEALSVAHAKYLGRKAL